MKKVIKIIMVIIGSIIGAGFASGKEIYLFFTRYGVYGKIGIVIMSLLVGCIIYFVLSSVKRYHIQNYYQFLQIINPKYEKINQLMNIIVNSFLLISFYIMVAGVGAYLQQVYQIPIVVSSVFFVIACYIIFQNNVAGVMKMNQIFVPILLILIFYLGGKITYVEEIQVNNFSQALGSSVLYASYNSILLIPLLISLQEFKIERKQIKKIAIGSSIFLFLLALIISCLLLKGIFYAKELELPLIQIVSEFGKVYPYLYGIIILISIFTSAITSGYSFLRNVTKNKKSYRKCLWIIVISAVLVSPVGFTKLIEVLYPVFGVLGILQIIMILKHSFLMTPLEKKAKN